MWPVWLEYANGPSAPVRYPHTLTEYKRDVTASAVAFRLVNEIPVTQAFFIRCPMPIQKAGNALVTPPGLRKSTGDENTEFDPDPIIEFLTLVKLGNSIRDAESTVSYTQRHLGISDDGR
ncbi:hypothetical protein EVAR_16424_1 [Eumeta japonica]|uniref:Uncharacterized protein n=1 Tax=Eumeta variegata TaxID=151549 RepID=A0A4C1ULV0_EUMVA|nr:hypothetical protein EVAR_16424_1 [Eumeta japonica]